MCPQQLETDFQGSAAQTSLRNKHGPYAGIRERDAFWVQPEKDVYAESINFGGRVKFEENFEQAAKLKAVLDTFTASVAAAELVAFSSANRNFSVLGTNMTSALSTVSPLGGNLLTLAGADLDSAILCPSLSTIQTAWSTVTWGSGEQVVWQANIVTGAAVTTQIIWAGLKLTNTPTAATDADQIYFRYEAGVSSGKWTVQHANTTVLTATVSNVAVAAATLYRLKIVVQADRTCKCYINGDLVVTTGALKASTNYIPYVGIKASGAGTAFTLRVLKTGMSKKSAA